MSGKIIIYQDANFGGASRELTSDVPYLSSVGFNDRLSSIKVIGSVWVGYKGEEYTDRQFILEEGDYPSPKDWHGSHDELSSLKKLNPDIGETPHITLYADYNYGGKAMSFEYEINDLNYYNFHDMVSSLKVKSGGWILYEHLDFKGKQWVVTKGSYSGPHEFGAENDKISSLRPIREPNYPTEVISMEFDIVSGLLNETPHALVNLSQRNNTSTDQNASWNTSRTETTTKTFAFHWENSTVVSAETEFTTGVPIIAEGKIRMGVENTYVIGQNSEEENTQTDEWSFNLPAIVKAKTILKVQVNIQQGKIDVPFKAVMQKGGRQWTEVGTYVGTQSYNLQVDYNETPL